MINAKLQNIIDTKSAIGNAIVNKGGTITGETPFFNYATEIDNISTGSVLTGNATTDVVFNGFTFYGNDANTQLTGTFVFDGNAVVGDVSTGKTFYATNGTKLTGTLVPATPSTIDGNDANIMSLVSVSNILGGTVQSIAINNGYVFAGSTTGNLAKFHQGNLAFVANVAVGSGILDIAINNSSVFVVSLTNIVRKYHESNLVLAANSTLAGVQYADKVVSNNGFIFIADTLDGYFNGTVKKIHESNLVLNATSSNINSGAIGLALNNAFVYAGGGSIDGVRKFHESNLVFSTNSNAYGGLIRNIKVNNAFVYAGGGTNRTVQKFHESNLVFNIASNNYSGDIYQLGINNGYLYVAGATTEELRKLHESNLVFVNSVTYGRNIFAMNISNSVYIGGATVSRVYRFLEGTPFTNSVDNKAWYLIPKE